jgi:hypothetical protein
LPKLPGRRTPSAGLAARAMLEFAATVILLRMTLIEITYQLQAPLTPQQLAILGEFANTYGLRRFRVDEGKNQLSLEYDASRLKETQVMHVLRAAKIPVTGKMEIGGTDDRIPTEPSTLAVSRVS